MKGKLFVLFVVIAALLVGSLGSIQAREDKAVIIAFDQEFDNLNPMYTTMYFTGISRGLYLAPAWDFDDQLNPHPVLVKEIPSAENGGVSADGKTLTLHLRDDIVWSDGEPITAADFAFTYEMIMDDSNSPLSRYPYDVAVAGVETPDERTVVVNFNEPFAGWVGTIFSYVLPEHVLRPVYDEDFSLDGAAWNRAPEVGSGPYIFDEWETGSYIRFKRNENYFGPTPKLDIVSISFIPDSASYVIALENGAADVGTFIAYSDVPGLQENGNVSVQIIASGYNEAWFLNMREGLAHPAMLDVNVRKALVMAFNRQQITEDLLLGLTYPPTSFWEGTPYDPADLEAPAFDPEMAKQLLEEAGWVDSDGDGIREKDGEKLSLRYVTNTRQIRIDTSVVAQQQLKDVGVDLVLQTYPSDIYFNGYAEGGPIATGQYDIAEWSGNPAGFPDPDTGRFLCSQIPTDDEPDGANWTGYCNEEVDALFAEQARTMDYDARVAIFNQIATAMADDYVWAGVWYDPDLWVVNNRVAGAKLNGVTPFWNIDEWDVN
jgi:peptide/nickel transport system substrate-binding protein